jgi:3-methylcrotonyl-CoA carboxylase beta subunit
VGSCRARGKLLTPRSRRVSPYSIPGTNSTLSEIDCRPLDVYGEDVHFRQMIAGVSQVAGRLCVVASDATVKTCAADRQGNACAPEIAAQNALPCVYLVDSGGANLPRYSRTRCSDRRAFRPAY